MKKLKIGLVFDDTLDTPDGVAQYVLTLGAWLSARGHEVHYLVGETKRRDLANLHSLSRNLHVRFNGNRMTTPLPVMRSKLIALLEHEKFDVLHVQMPYSPWLAQRIIRAASARAAIVGTFHLLPYSRLANAANYVLALMLRPSLKRFDQVFAVTSAAQAYTKRAYGTEAAVLPNMVDAMRFARAKVLPQYSDDIVTIMFLGRLVPRKGCMILLEAANILRKRKNLPPFRVVVCGKGPLDAELKRYVSEQSLNDTVDFTGFVSEDDKPRYVASADIMCYPSSGGESFGIVLLEAMASGRAVVLAGDNPGYRSVLAPKSELLFPPTSAFELANKLTTYLRDPNARAEVIGWETDYIKQFDIAEVGQKLLNAYIAGCRKHIK